MTETGGGREVRGAWLALGLLTTLNLFNFIDRYILPAVQPQVQAEFHLSDAQIGALTTAFFVTYVIAGVATGWLGDRFPRKPLIVAGALLWSGATLLTATVHSYESLYFRHAVVGIGEASFSIFAPVLLADFWPGEQRNRILTVFYLSLPVGAALGYVVGGTLGGAYGWRAPFYVAAAPGAVIALLILSFMKEPQRGACDAPAAEMERLSFSRRIWLGLLRNPAYWTATLGMAMMVFSMGGISFWLPSFVHRHGGYGLAAANQMIGAITVVDGIAGTWVGGWLAQRWLRTNRGALYLISAWSMLLCLPAALVVFFGPARFMVAGIAVAEFFLFLNTGPLNAAIVNSVGPRVRATAVAVELLVIHALGDVPSPLLIGYVSDHSRYHLRLGMSLTLVSMVISGSLLLFGARYAPSLKKDAVELA